MIGKYVRGHWAIGNRLHWHLDVTFREDFPSAQGLFSHQPKHTKKVRLSYCLTIQRQTILTEEVIQGRSECRLPQKPAKDLMRYPAIGRE